MTADRPSGRHWSPDIIGAAPIPPDFSADAEHTEIGQPAPSTISGVFGQELPELTPAERALLTEGPWRESSEPPVIGEGGSPRSHAKRLYFTDPTAAARSDRFYEGLAGVELADEPVQRGPRHAMSGESAAPNPAPATDEERTSVVEEFGAGLAADDPARDALAAFESRMGLPVQAAEAQQHQAADTEPATPELAVDLDFTTVELSVPADVRPSAGYQAKYRVFQELLARAQEDAAEAIAVNEAARLSAVRAARPDQGAHRAQPNSVEVDPLALVHQIAGMSPQVADLMRDRINQKRAALVPLMTAENQMLPWGPSLENRSEPETTAWDWFAREAPLEPGTLQPTIGRDGRRVFEGSTPARYVLEAAAASAQNQSGTLSLDAPTLPITRGAPSEPETMRLQRPSPAAEAPPFSPEWPAVEPPEDDTMVEPPASGNQATVYFPSAGKISQDVKPSN